MNKRIHLFCAHCGAIYVLVVLVGLFWVAGWLPPVAPRVEGDQIVALFAEDRTRIRVGITILVGSSLFWWPFSAAVSAQLRRIEGERGVLASVQLAASSGISLVTLFAGYAWLVAAFRPATSSGVIQFLSDFAWLTYVGAWPPAIVQSVAIAVCILASTRARNPYPRWVGYLNVWMSFMYLPGMLAPFFREGPFAWNGAITFWVVAVAYFGYILVMWRMTVKAIKQPEPSPTGSEMQAA